MTRLLAAAVLVAGASVSPALACTIDSCWYTQPFCQTRLVDCSDLNPVWGCTDTAAGTVCVPDPRTTDIPPIIGI
jgi:hypothetical protein